MTCLTSLGRMEKKLYKEHILQCSILFTGPQWLKHDPNDPEWLTMPKDDIPEVKGAPGGQGGRQGARGGTRGRQMGPGYSWRQNKW